MKINFIIPGPPQGKARPKVTRTKNGFSHTYTPDKTVAYEELVRTRYLAATNAYRFPDGAQIKMEILATVPIPQSKSRRVKADMLEGRTRPTKKPDCDNIIKIICDALNGLAYRDDAQIVEVSIRKAYADGGEVSVMIQDI